MMRKLMMGVTLVVVMLGGLAAARAESAYHVSLCSLEQESQSQAATLCNDIKEALAGGQETELAGHDGSLGGMPGLRKALSEASEALSRADLDTAVKAGLAEHIDKLRKDIAQRYFDLAELMKKQDQTARAAFCYRFASQWGMANPKIDSFLKAYVWYEPYGWVKAKNLDNMQQGLRPSRGEWLTEDEFAQRHNSWKTPVILQSDNWKLQTDVDYAIAMDLLKRLEAELDFFLMELGPCLNARMPEKKLEVYLFNSEEEYRNEFEAAVGYRPEGDSGRFNSKTGRSYFFYFDGADGIKRGLNFYQIAQHEALHQMVHFLTDHKVPELVSKGHYWLVEGTADYCMYVGVDADGIPFFQGASAFTDNERFKVFADLLDKKQTVEMRRFVALDQEQFHALATPVAGYAQAHCLTMFLMQKHRASFEGYLTATLLKADVGDDVFAAAMGDIDKLESEFYQWFADMRDSSQKK